MINQDPTFDTPGVHLSDDPEVMELQKQLFLVQARMENATLKKQLAKAHGLLAEREELDHKALHNLLVEKLNAANEARLKGMGSGPQPLASTDPLSPKK